MKTWSLGMIAATLLITVLYVCFIFSYTELSTTIPQAGGPYAFARRAFNPLVGYMAGIATLIETALAGICHTTRAATMQAAVQAAARFAQPGDTVLLSPACSSLDMFRDYAERGNVFAAAVKELA